MSYQEITTENELLELMAKSSHKPQVIFKHSTRCYISSRVLKNTQSSFEDPRADWYLLDLIAFRNLSNEIEKLLTVAHQSPQLEFKCAKDLSDIPQPQPHAAWRIQNPA